MGAQTCKIILNTLSRGFLAMFQQKFVYHVNVDFLNSPRQKYILAAEGSIESAGARSYEHQWPLWQLDPRSSVLYI